MEADLQKYGKYKIQFGCHWTPVLYKGKLYLQVMHRNTQKLVCLDADTGKEDWAVDRPGYVKVPSTARTESPDVYASAFVWEGEGGPLLVAHGNDYSTGHKLDDGSEVWRVPGLNPPANGAWRFVSCPLLTPDLIVVPSCKDGPTVGIQPGRGKGDIDPENKAEMWRAARHVPHPGCGHPDPRRTTSCISPATDHSGRSRRRRQANLPGDLTGSSTAGNMVAADGKITSPRPTA